MKSKGQEALILDSQIQGLSEEDLGNIIKQNNPDIIGLSSVTPNFPMACRIAKKLKTISDAVIFYGGIHASTFREKIIKRHAEFDIIVYGKGEVTMTALAETLDRSDFSTDSSKK